MSSDTPVLHNPQTGAAPGPVTLTPYSTLVQMAEAHARTLYGEAHDGKMIAPGLVQRVTTLEQFQEEMQVIKQRLNGAILLLIVLGVTNLPDFLRWVSGIGLAQ